MVPIGVPTHIRTKKKYDMCRIYIIKKFIKTYQIGKDDLLVRNNHIHFVYI